MSWTGLPANQATDWSAIGFLNQFVDAINERLTLSASLGASSVFLDQVAAGDDVSGAEAAAGLIYSFQTRVECAAGVTQPSEFGKTGYLLRGYCDDAYRDLSGQSYLAYNVTWFGDPTLTSTQQKQAWRTYCGLNTGGFTRKYPDGSGGVTTAYGYFQEGDYVGPWIWNELKTAVQSLQTFVPYADRTSWVGVMLASSTVGGTQADVNNAVLNELSTREPLGLSGFYDAPLSPLTSSSYSHCSLAASDVGQYSASAGLIGMTRASTIVSGYAYTKDYWWNVRPLLNNINLSVGSGMFPPTCTIDQWAQADQYAGFWDGGAGGNRTFDDWGDALTEGVLVKALSSNATLTTYTPNGGSAVDAYIADNAWATADNVDWPTTGTSHDIRGYMVTGAYNILYGFNWQYP